MGKLSRGMPGTLNGGERRRVTCSREPPRVIDGGRTCRDKHAAAARRRSLLRWTHSETRPIEWQQAIMALATDWIDLHTVTISPLGPQTAREATAVVGNEFKRPCLWPLYGRHRNPSGVVS